MIDKHWLDCRSVAVMILIVFCAARGPYAQAAAPTGKSDVRQIWQLLDYVGVDYAGAVGNGAITNEAEYREMVEFVATARQRLATVPGVTEQQRAEADQLEKLVSSKAAASVVAQLARKLASELLTANGISAAPQSIPDRIAGAVLYQSECAPCHGPTGKGDGPAGLTLDPRPIAFTDATRAGERSLFALYQAVTQGVAGTGMKPFPQLTDEQRWALAFMVGQLAYDDENASSGERLWKRNAPLRRQLSSLDAIARTSESDLRASLSPGEAHAAMAFLRVRPEAVLEGASSGDSLSLARQLIDKSRAAYAAGDFAGATRLALAGYLDGFEPVEPRLAARNRDLLNQVESAMAEYRSLLGRRAQESEVAAQASRLIDLIARADIELENSEGSATTAFIASFTILLREGVEALLIVVAMLAFLGKANRRDVVIYVHAGWVGALVAGAVTWGVATYAVSISGASRELTEGLSSLFAAVVLLAVGIWMHQKSLAGRWQEYVRSKLTAALTRRSAWVLFALAFLTVYREVFETILFYIALWNEQNGASLLAGLGAGVAALAVIAFALMRFSRRLPIGQFFKWSSLLIAVLAVVLVGKGIAALQEAGWIGIYPISSPRVPVLGIFPSAQVLVAQLAVLACAVIGFVANRPARSS